MLDDGGGYDVGGLRALIVTHDESDEAIFLEDRHGEAVFARLEGSAQLEDEKSVFVDRVGPDFDGRDGRRRAHCCAVRFELQDLDAISHHRTVIEAGSADALQKLGSRGRQQGEIGVIVDCLDLRGRFEGRLRFFQFNVGVVVDQFGGNEDAAVHQNNPKALTQDLRILAPWLGEIE